MAHIVVLDFGHGGSKAGAVYEGAVEKQLNLLTGREIYRSLHEQETGRDLRVLLTRDEDHDIPLTNRCGLINKCADDFAVNGKLQRPAPILQSNHHHHLPYCKPPLLCAQRPRSPIPIRWHRLE